MVSELASKSVATHVLRRIKISLDIDPESFAERCRAWASQNPRPPLQIWQLWNEEIFDRLHPLLIARRILAVRLQEFPGLGQIFRSPDELCSAGDISVWWHDVELHLPLTQAFSQEDILLPVNIEWQFHAFGLGNYYRTRMWQKILKTKKKCRIQIVKAIFPKWLFQAAFAKN